MSTVSILSLNDHKTVKNQNILKHKVQSLNEQSKTVDQKSTE